jgi:hypothetical protein
MSTAHGGLDGFEVEMQYGRSTFGVAPLFYSFGPS